MLGVSVDVGLKIIPVYRDADAEDNQAPACHGIVFHLYRLSGILLVFPPYWPTYLIRYYYLRTSYCQCTLLAFI